MPKVTHVVTNIFTVVVWKHCFVSIENRLILPNEKGNLYRRSDVCTDSWRRWEKEAQQGEVKTGLCVVLRDDWIDSEMCTLREWKGRGIPFERKDGFHFGYVGSEEPVRHWSKFGRELCIWLSGENLGLKISLWGLVTYQMTVTGMKSYMRWRNWVWDPKEH